MVMSQEQGGMTEKQTFDDDDDDDDDDAVALMCSGCTAGRMDLFPIFKDEGWGRTTFHLDEAGVDVHVLDGSVEVELDALEKPWLVVLPILILGVLQAGWQVRNTGASTLDDVAGRPHGCGPRYAHQ